MLLTIAWLRLSTGIAETFSHCIAVNKLMAHYQHKKNNNNDINMSLLT